MSPVSSILELPFREQPVLELLGFDLKGEREAVNLEDTRFGWCRPEVIWLDAGGEGGASGGAGLVEVRRPLLLALHSADDGPALANDVVLEFVLEDEGDAAGSVAAPLSLFLERWLPRLLTGSDAGDGAAPIVLAMCNPHRAQLVAPAAAAGRVMHYALGDVDSWLETAGPPGGAGDRIRLVAPRWQRADARTTAR